MSTELLTVGGSDGELLESFTKRCYAIRCRIVHSKNTDTFEPPLLPLSDETQFLKHDLALLHHAVLRVLSTYRTT